MVLPLMRCIRCKGADWQLEAATLACRGCGARYRVHNDIPLMIEDPDAAINFAPEVVVENHYSEQWNELLRRAGAGPVLDLGSGNNPNPVSHLIKLDIFALPHVDVVGMAENLPFRDGTFRTVMSGAVFEHVQNPFYSISEVHRVLAEEGDVYIETAFLQPVHAFPSHYFNMTRMGLEYVCRDFKKFASGAQPHQNPAFALSWYLDVFASKLPFAAKHEFLRMTVAEILDECQVNPLGTPLLKHLSEQDREQLACGVYFYGRKTQNGAASVAPLPEATAEARKLPGWRRVLRGWRRLRRAFWGLVLRLVAPIFAKKSAK